MYTPTSFQPTEIPEANEPALSASGSTLTYTLPETEEISLELFDLLGRKVATLQEGYQQEGAHTVRLENRGLPSGVYLVRLAGPFAQAAQKVVIMR